jgi:hypothetical protein
MEDPPAPPPEFLRASFTPRRRHKPEPVRGTQPRHSSAFVTPEPFNPNVRLGSQRRELEKTDYADDGD